MCWIYVKLPRPGPTGRRVTRVTSTSDLCNIGSPCPGWRTAVGACEEGLQEQLTCLIRAP